MTALRVAGKPLEPFYTPRTLAARLAISERCAIEGCTHPRGRVKSKHLCEAHYARWLRHGDPLGGGPPSNRRVPLIDRFWLKVNREGPVSEHRPDLGPCWIWTAGLANGYGALWAGSRHVKAHRFSYELHIGPIPIGLQIDHLCRVRNCVKPTHLEPVTKRENQRRAPEKTHCPQGHPYEGENLFFDRGAKACMTCRREKGRERARRYRAEKRAA